MDNNNDNNDFNYVQEKIKSKSKKRIRKAVLIVGTSLVAAVVFGFVARLVFVASEGAVNKLLGITPTPTPIITQAPVNPRSQVTLGEKITITPTLSPTPTQEPVVTPDEVTLTPVDTVTPTPSAEPVPTEDPKSGDGHDDSSDKETPSALETYMQMMSELRSVASKASKSIIRVYSVKSGINWMDESIETKTELTGAVMTDNGVELLILVDYASVAGSDRIELEFADGVVADGTLYCFDSDVGLAIIAVPLTNISVATMSTYTYLPLGDSDRLYEGEPVIAIGRPNGYYGAVEFGFISHSGLKNYFIDGMTTGFTTDITPVANADGIVIDLEGRMVGLMENQDNQMTCAVSINSLRPLLLKLLNNASVPYFGIRAENIPADILAGMGQENGIYVNEVISGSPAAEAGLKKGDVIVMTDETRTESVSDFYGYLLAAEENGEMAVSIYRGSIADKPEETLTVTLSSKQTKIK